MASYNRNNNQNHDIGQWIGIFIAFCVSPPLGLLLGGIKFYNLYRSKKNGQYREKWRQQSQQWRQQGWTQNDYQAQQTTYSKSQQQTYYSHASTSGGQGSYAQPSANPYSARQQQAAPGRPKSRWNQQLIAKITNPRKGRTQIWIGSLLAVLCGILTVLMFIDNFWMLSYGYWMDMMTTLAATIMGTGAGFVLMHFGRKKSKEARLYRQYLSIIGNQNAVKLQELSRVSGVAYEDLCDDLSDLLAQGVFGQDAYIDLSTQYLILNMEGRDEVNESIEKAKAEQQAKEMPHSPQDDILMEIRKVNDDIDDPRLSEQIDRIEEITRLILQYQTEHPEKSGQLHSFLSYYLPTTLKILNSYAEMENQTIQGKNISETRQRVEQIMDKVVKGFETQLDMLFADDRMDIASEINVLENMMQQDGLTSDEESDPFAQFRNVSQGM